MSEICNNESIGASFLPTTTRSWVLANPSKGLPTYSSSDENTTFQLVERPLPELSHSQVLLKSLYYSNDPAQRPSIDHSIPSDRMYTPHVQIQSPMRAYGLGEVLSSTSDNIQKGDIVTAPLGWNEFAVVAAKSCNKIIPLPGGLNISHYLGAFGATGITAYYGLIEIGEARTGQRVVISGAAGATGSMAVQIAKHIIGCSEVIGIAGTDEKCRWVESLGADKCLNYKSKSFAEDLVKATETFVDVYFDNVGGEILDLMLGRLKPNGIVVACGAVSSYNHQAQTVLKNYFYVITMRLQIRGFIVLDYMSKGDNTKNTLELFRKAFSEGKLKVDDKNEHIVETRFEDVPKTWLTLFSGGNTGKLLTKLV